MKRMIEISAASKDEAVELAKRELRMGEVILATEVIVSPIKGVFGVVGNPDVRVRFSLGERNEGERQDVPASPTGENKILQEEDEEEDDDLDEDSEDIFSESGPHQPSDRAFPPASRGVPRENTPRNHPLHDSIIGLFKDVATNIGVAELSLSESSKDEVWMIDASGSNVAQLIGKRGWTLDALQYIFNIIVNKGQETKTKIILDAQGYRDQRQRTLIKLAKRMSRKALESGKQVELEPMSTVDRRTVHLALKDVSGVETFSKGIEPQRKVVISPQKPSQQNTFARSPRQPRENSNNNGARSRSVPMFFGGDKFDEN